MAAPPQWSRDGAWWWDGQHWIPASQAPPPPLLPAPGGPVQAHKLRTVISWAAFASVVFQIVGAALSLANHRFLTRYTVDLSYATYLAAEVLFRMALVVVAVALALFLASADARRALVWIASGTMIVSMLALIGQVVEVVLNLNFDADIVGWAHPLSILNGVGLGIWFIVINSIGRKPRLFSNGLSSVGIVAGIGLLVANLAPAVNIGVVALLVPVWLVWLGVIFRRPMPTPLAPADGVTPRPSPGL